MSLQWHSPPQARVAAWVHNACGIIPAPSECPSVLDTNSCETEAAKTLLAMYEAELWRLGIMSQAQRRVAALVRNQTGRFPSVQEIDYYLDFAHGSFESAASWLLVEYARQEEREYQESVLAHQRQQLAHIYSQPRPSAPGLGGVDLATEQLLEGGGLGTQMVRNERDLAAEEHWNKLLATDGSSATVPSVDPLSSTCNMHARVFQHTHTHTCAHTPHALCRHARILFSLVCRNLTPSRRFLVQTLSHARLRLLCHGALHPWLPRDRHT